MSIQTTKEITRETAIRRILAVYELILRSDYKGLYGITSEDTDEDDSSLMIFIDSGCDFSVKNIDKWTDKMIGNKLSEPFYRVSMFDNYNVRSE